ncbi:hypothetical protein [Frankia sp. AvcI1]|uniref:hypothetical protein n=1 Tax=Frankia sp. AvcI1 TaxID=573496 RepID=UPI0021199D14|nr:hypothetical protein [Frankia sp. AvcI1]
MPAPEPARCLPPGGDLETRLRRWLESGAIVEGDAIVVRRFAAFLADVAAHPDEPRAAVYARHYPEETGTDG